MDNMDIAEEKKTNRMQPPKRIAQTIINALGGGVVPRVGLGYIAVGRTAEINALLRDADIAEDGGAFFRFIVGRFGSGKSFLIQTMRQHLCDRGFAVADADLSPERRLMGSGNQGLATYRELMKNLSVKAKPDGGALPLILEKWIDGIRTSVIADGTTPDNTFFDAAVERRIHSEVQALSDMVHGFDFARVINEYYKAYRDDNAEHQNNALRWLRGEYTTKSEAKRELSVSSVISDDSWYDYIKLMTSFLAGAGYKGLVIMIDELVNIARIPNSITRQYNYEKILMMYNDVMQGKAHRLGIIMGGTPQSIEDGRRGVFSYEALKSRLESGRFTAEGVDDLLSPIIRLKPLSYEELTVLTEKLTEIHAGLYGYESRITTDDRVAFIKQEFGRVGAQTNITPREMIRDYIALLNLAYQCPDKPIQALISGEDVFAPADNTGEDGFEDFEI